jgi:hypothetical protein
VETINQLFFFFFSGDVESGAAPTCSKSQKNILGLAESGWHQVLRITQDGLRCKLVPTHGVATAFAAQP